jgi:type III secretion system YopN/LcrE/InvE/MxiC family regulator
MAVPTEVVRQNIAAFNVISPVGAEVMQEARGAYRGEEVVASSESSKLADAAEELGMSVAHRADKRTLAQREVRQGSGANLEALARIADYYDKLPDMPREVQLKALVDQLESFQQLMEKAGSGGGGPTKEDILAALRDFDGDVTHQYAALDLARDYFAAAGAPSEFQLLLDEARGEFEKTDIARDVRAGFAAAEVAAKAAATLETDPATVRDTYRAMLRETMNMGQLFDSLGKFDVMKSFTETVATFMEAAGRDLSGTTSSTDPGFLHGLLTELSKLKKLQSVMDGTTQLVRTTERLLPKDERGQIDVRETASRLLNFAAQSAVGLADARVLLGKLQTAEPASQLAFATGLHGLHGEIPDDVMPSMQARLQQNATLRSLLDRLVSEEEEAFDKQQSGGKPKRDTGDN